MSSYRHDPTAGAAIGSIDRQLNEARKRARELHKLSRAGRLTRQMEDASILAFHGIFRQALLNELYRLETKAEGSER